jgi:hypothetical protein
MEEPGEHCTVVFALIVTELAGECVGVGVGSFLTPPPPHTTSRFRNTLCKDDSALFSRFLHVVDYIRINNPDLYQISCQTI